MVLRNPGFPPMPHKTGKGFKTRKQEWGLKYIFMVGRITACKHNLQNLLLSEDLVPQVVRDRLMGIIKELGKCQAEVEQYKADSMLMFCGLQTTQIKEEKKDDTQTT